MIGPDIAKKLESLAIKLTGISEDEYRSKSRQKHIVRTRYAVFLTARELGMSFATIAKQFGGYDHTTILNAVRRAISIRETDSNFDSLVKTLIVSVKDWQGIVQGSDAEFHRMLSCTQLGEIEYTEWAKGDLIKQVVIARAESFVRQLDPRKYQTVTVPVDCKGKSYRVHFEAKVTNGFIGLELVDFHVEGALP